MTLAEIDAIRARLSLRQQQVLAWMLDGVLNKCMAYDLGISSGGVTSHCRVLYKAFGVRGRPELERLVFAAIERKRAA